MTEFVQIGQGSYTGATGEADGNISDAAAQLNPGDIAQLTLTFPGPVNFIPADWIMGALSPVFALAGSTLQGVDFSDDSTLILVFRVGG